MKGIKHLFSREVRFYGVKIEIGAKYQCNFKKKTIVVPVQKDDFAVFVGFHELAHYVLHRGDKRNYDDLLARIEIEQEADYWANSKMTEYGYKTQCNNSTLGLIALFVYQGGEYQDFEVEIDGRSIGLFRKGFPEIEIWGNFLSNLPLHPSPY